MSAIPREELSRRLRRGFERFKFTVNAEIVWQSQKKWGRVQLRSGGNGSESIIPGAAAARRQSGVRGSGGRNWFGTQALRPKFAEQTVSVKARGNRRAILRLAPLAQDGDPKWIADFSASGMALRAIVSQRFRRANTAHLSRWATLFRS